jgi:hypothetical protein
MATIKIDNHSATVTMDNGSVIPVPTNYEAITIRRGAAPYLITFSDGAEWWITSYRPDVIDGLSGDIEDGATFAPGNKGCAWTRYGDEVLSSAPGQGLNRAV